MKDAEYFVGFARESLGGDFYRGAPKLRLIQLISAGYDRLDVGAARRAGVPVANNGGAQSGAGGARTLIRSFGGPREVALHPHNHLTPNGRGWAFSPTRRVRGPGRTRQRA